MVNVKDFIVSLFSHLWMRYKSSNKISASLTSNTPFRMVY